MFNSDFYKLNFPRLAATGKPDYANAFLAFSPVTYLQNNLEHSMLSQDSDYLLDLLRHCCRIRISGEFRLETVGNLSLLLKLGAGPNSALSSQNDNYSLFRENDIYSVWQFF